MNISKFISNKFFLLLFVIFNSLVFGSITNAIDVDCKALYDNKTIKKDFIVDYSGYIKCGYYSDFKMKITPKSGNVLTERFNLSNTDRFMLIGKNGKTWIYKNLDKSKYYTIDLQNIRDVSGTIKSFGINISTNNKKILSINSNDLPTLPVFSIKDLVIVTLDQTSPSNIKLLYSENKSGTKGKISVSGINAKDWYQSSGTCKGKSCERNYYYNWYLGKTKDGKVSDIILNIYYDFDHTNSVSEKELVYSTYYKLPVPLDVSDAKATFDSTIKNIDVSNITKLTFTDGLKLVRLKFYNNIADGTFIIKGIKKEALSGQEIASTLGKQGLPTSCEDIMKQGITSNGVYQIYPNATNGSVSGEKGQNIGIKEDNNSIRLWADGTYANDCSAYKFPNDKIHSYTGEIGSGWYWVKPKGINLGTFTPTSSKKYKTFNLNLKSVSEIDANFTVNSFYNHRNNLLAWDPSNDNDLFLFVLKNAYSNQYGLEINDHQYYYNQIFKVGKTYNIRIIFDWKNKKTILYVNGKKEKTINEVPNRTDNTFYIDNENGSSYCNATFNSLYIIPTNYNPKKTKVYCDMTTDGGGWTLVSKIKSNSTQWYYDSKNWTTNTTLNEDNISDINSNEDYKNNLFNNDYIIQARFCMGGNNNCIVSNISTNGEKNTLKNIFANDKEISDNTKTRSDYINWSGANANIFANEPNCNKIGFNLKYPWFKVRYGIEMNNENDCKSVDDYIGFGISNYNQNFGGTRTPNSVGFKQRKNNVKYNRQGWIWVRSRTLKDDSSNKGVSIYCDFTSPGGPYGFKIISNGLKVNYVTDKNSCEKYGLKFYTPTNWDMLNAERKYLESIGKSLKDYGELGIYNTEHNSSDRHSGGWTANREMVSWNQKLTNGWVSSLGNTVQWYGFQTNRISEPNGDYYKNALLKYFYDDNNGFISWINDGRNTYSTTNYVCTTKDIGLKYDYDSSAAKNTAYHSCKEIKDNNPLSKNGYYWIKPANSKDNHPVKVYCDMTTDGGGWTLIDVKTRNYGDNFYDILNDMGIKYSKIMLEDIDHLTLFDQDKNHSDWDMHDVPYYVLQFKDSHGKVYMVGQRYGKSKWNSDPYRGCNNNKNPDYFIPFKNIKIVKPSTERCMFGNTNIPELCAEKVIIPFGKEVNIDYITDMESNDNACRGDNMMKAYFKIYVK